MKVVVIGGGILGASIAWHLRDKADLTVIDCGALGGLASRASLGWLNATSYLTLTISNSARQAFRLGGITALNYPIYHCNGVERLFGTWLTERDRR